MKVKIKKLHPNAIIPSYAKDGDAGLDMTAINREVNYLSNIITYSTGIALEVPKGFVGLVFPRSSIYKTNLSLTNSVGVIDSGYRGEIMFKYRIADNVLPLYEIGERIGQIIILPHPYIEFEEIQELSETQRGVGGFGSTN